MQLIQLKKPQHIEEKPERAHAGIDLHNKGYVVSNSTPKY